MATSDVNVTGHRSQDNFVESMIPWIPEETTSQEDLVPERGVFVDFRYEEIPGASKLVSLENAPAWEPDIVLTRRVVEAPLLDE